MAIGIGSSWDEEWYPRNEQKLDTSLVTRVEIIDHQTVPTVGRAYVKTDCKNVEIQLQDDGRTLKIFISK